MECSLCGKGVQRKRVDYGDVPDDEGADKVACERKQDDGAEMNTEEPELGSLRGVPLALDVTAFSAAIPLQPEEKAEDVDADDWSD